MYPRLKNTLFWVFVLLFALPRLALTADAEAPSNEELRVLDKGGTAPNSFPANASNLPDYRWAAGLSYLGAQIRYLFSPRWALEGRAQFGDADSQYGRVHSKVFGLRAYRFYPFSKYERMAWYIGGEGAYASSDTDSSSYTTHGFALGGFGGMEYRILKRVSLGIDIGPYVISLKESQTGLTNTGLDFVVNTAINFYLFK